jgi:hypothetical protein
MRKKFELGGLTKAQKNFTTKITSSYSKEEKEKRKTITIYDEWQ